MKLTNLVLVAGVFSLFFALNGASAEPEIWSNTKNIAESGVFIPDDEFIGYFDSNGIYTVVGAIKNQESYQVTPSVRINIEDDATTISKVFKYVPIQSLKELPFKLKFPEIKSQNPILNEPEIVFEVSKESSPKVEVIYDDSLIQHEDGHLTGYIINNGEETVYNIKVFAIIHGLEHQTLDMGENIRLIKKLEPGEIQSFQMYPDPAITSEIFYYSCFAITDSFVRPLFVERNDNKFYFRYDSGTWYTTPEFDEDGTELSLRTLNSFPIETYANFEFPKFSDDEKLEVFVNGEKKNSIQSIDERNNWHVAFNVEPREGGDVLITGFKEGWNPGDKIYLPDWIKFNAYSWSNGKANDQIFIKGIDFLIKEKIIDTSDKTLGGSISIPNWVKTNSLWWSEGKISNETFVRGLEFLIKQGIIQI